MPPSQPATQPIAAEAQIEAAIARLGFDPRTAPAQELREHDLPLPPNAPANSSAYQSWLYTAVSPVTNVVHTGVLTDLYNGRGQRTGAEIKLSGSSVSPDCTGCGNYSLNSPNWSGYEGDGGQGTFGLISGQWNVPSAAAQMPSGTYYDAMWVGIDGGYSHYPFPNSSDVFQTGTETKVTSNGSYQTGVFYIWYEWYPQASHLAFYTAPYDSDWCEVYKYSTNGQYAGEWYCMDNTTGATENTATYVNSTLVSNTGEWIVERPC